MSDGKAVSCAQSFDCTGSHKNEHVMLTYQEIKSCATAVLTILCGNIFPSLMLNMCSFFLLTHVHQWPSDMPSVFSTFDSTGGTLGLFLAAREECTYPSVLHQLPGWGVPNNHMGNSYIIGSDLALSLLYESKVLFQPVIDCFVFSLAALIQWAEALGVCPWD